MNSLKRQMLEDKALRDAAKALVEADRQHLRENFSNKGLAARAIERLSEGASDVYEEAAATASDNKGALAAIVAALVLWFARNPISDLLNSERATSAPGHADDAQEDPKLQPDSEIDPDALSDEHNGN